MSSVARTLRFDRLHRSDGWFAPGYVAVDDRGVIASVADTDPGDGPVEHVRGFAVPGMPNLHSHAFQRVFAGRTECSSEEGGDDSFWTWRTQMYAFAERIDPAAMAPMAWWAVRRR